MTQSTTGLVELKPCPLCTSSDIRSYGLTAGPLKWWAFQCRECKVEIVKADEPTAMTAWNTRPTDPTIAELVAALEKAREALKPSGETKAAYIGEFKFVYTVWDPEGEQEINHHVTVPWTTIKEIMAAIRERALPPTKSRSAP